MDKIMSEPSRKALAAVAPAFGALQDQIITINQRTKLCVTSSTDHLSPPPSETELYTSAQEALVNTSKAFDTAAEELRTHIRTEITDQIKKLRESGRTVNDKNLAITLSDHTKQDIRTLLVINCIGNLMKFSLKCPADRVGIEYFDDMFQEALQPREEIRGVKPAASGKQRLNDHTFDKAFSTATRDLQRHIFFECLYNQAWDEGYGPNGTKRLGPRVAAVAGSLLGATMASWGLDGGWTTLTLGLLGGGILTGGGVAIAHTHYLCELPSRTMRRAGCDTPEGVSTEARSLVELHHDVSAQTAAEMLAAALERAVHKPSPERGAG